ncbi:MAG: hypothetical protein MJA27_11400 [Pseudanabaenales cyanobacterium]|nr:hypothetical protein [Pseudanabaenales cyanobacterium]
MFLVDAFLNATVYCGLLYLAVAAIIYAVDWTESRIKLVEQVDQAIASTQSCTGTRVEPESLVKAAETELAAA